MSADRLRPIRDQPSESSIRRVRPSANIARYLSGSAIESRTSSSQSFGLVGGRLIATVLSVGCSNIEARRKSVPPQFGHFGIDSAGSNETGNEHPWQMNEPTPAAGSPACWTLSSRCPITTIGGAADITPGTAKWLVTFSPVVRKVQVFWTPRHRQN